MAGWMAWLAGRLANLKAGHSFEHPGNQASSPGEAKDSALLSSRDAGLSEPPERLQ